MGAILVYARLLAMRVSLSYNSLARPLLLFPLPPGRLGGRGRWPLVVFDNLVRWTNDEQGPSGCKGATHHTTQGEPEDPAARGREPGPGWA